MKYSKFVYRESLVKFRIYQLNRSNMTRQLRVLYFSKFSCSLRMRHINLELSFFRMYIFYLHLFQELDILQILYKTSNMYKFHPDSNLDILCLFKLHLNKILQRLYHNGNYLKIRKRRKKGMKVTRKQASCKLDNRIVTFSTQKV